MSAVTISAEGFVVDADTLAGAFGLAAAEVPVCMSDGAITSLCETGVGADAGRYRLTFNYAGRALRLTLDSEGNILSRVTFDRGPNLRTSSTLR